ncbi:histidyl-tRNA synthetase [Nosema bombycis CQ1]|uniref:histidine--tRNA ligase n=1 Tax=Nosema bombycis (strain CQ1 / CVCC 102059) TaxID=578461 RepID=R0M7Z3_NOSB1|nr:histidyl-tRNA synthetase [Nosema bombycis CQ1]|eukprot:EOB14119.1 histidyl-tRNA synthetase [Nosema bombycis CQ1]
MDLRTPKGTTDYPPKHALLYEDIINKTISVFKTYGALPIDTPIFELKEILLNKYGEDTKLIYDLKGEECALRYDLTVPFSRFMAMNKLKKIKRYQIGKVFRRDQPSIVKGRLREFIQADLDIAGDGLPMVVDSEILSCANTLLEMYGIGPFEINISDRRILISILKMAQVEEKDIGTISSTIDKVEKLSKEELDKEFELKGLSKGQIEIIHKYISQKGDKEVKGVDTKDIGNKVRDMGLNKGTLKEPLRDKDKDSLSNPQDTTHDPQDTTHDLNNDTPINTNDPTPLCSLDPNISILNFLKNDPIYLLPECKEAISNLESLLRYADIYGFRKNLKINLSLARGLDYYTGLIIEASYKNSQVGSVLGGGRYDNLISGFQKGNKIPCAGFSIGISRIFSLLIPSFSKESEIQVFVSSSGGLFLEERMKILKKLRSHKIKSETFYTKRYNLNEHKENCIKKGIKYLIVVGQGEIEKGTVVIMELGKGEKMEVDFDEMNKYIN